MNAKEPITVLYHSADWDGLFCREIAKKFLPEATLIGWDFKDAPLNAAALHGGNFVILDLPVDRVFGLQFKDGWICRGAEQIQPIDRWDSSNIIWIDHHKTSIASHPSSIPGYRIDGVAACRLAWQWFLATSPQPFDGMGKLLPSKQAFVDRRVSEPLAVKLAGEYDIWDKRDPDAELFQHGLRSCELTDAIWSILLSPNHSLTPAEFEELVSRGQDAARITSELPLNAWVNMLLERGRVIQFVRDQEYKEVIQSQGFDVEFENLKMLACCSHECDIRSHLFAAGVKPHHQALLGFTFTGKAWRVSLYHAPGHEHLDLSVIAKKFGGGGHSGAAGMILQTLPFLP